MDKLQPQTVYVPVDKPTFDRSTTPKGNYNVVDNVTYEIVAYAHKLPGVYPLTGKELAALLKQTWQEAINRADKDNGVDMTDAEEDGPIMNFSDFLKSKGIEI